MQVEPGFRVISLATRGGVSIAQEIERTQVSCMFWGEMALLNRSIYIYLVHTEHETNVEVMTQSLDASEESWV